MPPARPPEAPAPRRRALSPGTIASVGSIRTLGVVVTLVALFAYFSITEPRFRGWSNIQFMAVQSVIVSLASIGATFVIISQGIDLSVGSVIALCMVVTAWGIKLGLSLVLSSLLGALTGAICGLANGLLVTQCRLVPFIATLGMMGIARGIAKLIAHSRTIPIDPEGWSHSWLALLTHNPLEPGVTPLPGAPHLPAWLLFAPAVWILLVLALAMAAVLRWTVFGRHVFAIGSNEDAARLCGVDVTRVKILIYTIAGVFTGLGGVVFCSRQALGNPTEAVGLELDVIAAVVIGGGSLNGGEGSVIGSLVGAAIMRVLRTGLIMKDVAAPWQEVLIGVIIIAAVTLDQLQHRRQA